MEIDTLDILEDLTRLAERGKLVPKAADFLQRALRAQYNCAQSSDYAIEHVCAYIWNLRAKYIELRDQETASKFETTYTYQEIMDKYIDAYTYLLKIFYPLLDAQQMQQYKADVWQKIQIEMSIEPELINIL